MSRAMKIAMLLYVAALVTCFAVARTARAQEKPAYPTRQWELGRIDYRDWTITRVDVIDTEGVCLYVAARSGDAMAITAVPKTQLPKGTGCQ